MNKSVEKFLEGKKLSLSERDNKASYKTKKLRSHKRPIKEPIVDSRAIDVPAERTSAKV